MLTMELKTWLDDKTGRRIALARHLHVSPSFVQKMVQPKADGGKDVPLDQCGPIEMFTEGFVTCEELRPDKLEHFKYMRERSAPELPGVAVVLPGDAVGYCDIQSCAKAA